MPSALFQFEEFELDYARFELRRKGRPLRLEKIPMELLQLLVESDGRLVTRQEIEKRLWGPDVFVDAEHGINTAVRKIRQALEDDPESPHFVLTVPRKGYRFIAAVRREKAEAGATAAQTQQAPDIAKARSAQGLSATAGAKPVRSGDFSGKRILLAVGAAALLLTWPTYRLAVSRSTRAASPVIRSIAVLPLENLSGDTTQEYFADGMTDELITMLAKHKSLRVISRTSVMQYKKTKKSLPEIARELSVDGIVEGSISRSQDKMRVTAQLVYGPTDTHLWAESYDRDLKDTLLLQQELAQGIAERVNIATASGAAVHAAHVPANQSARDAYYRGRYYWFSESYTKSRELFQEAIRQDPSYAAAYAGLADSYTAHAVEGGLRPVEAMPLAEAAAEKALELDDALPEAHHASAAVKLFFKWDWQGADAECRRALELNPNLSETHHLRAYVLSALNQNDQMVLEDKTAMELDPNARPWMLGYALLRARRFDEALAELQQRAEARPSFSILHALLSEAYLQKGNYAKAVEEKKKSLMIDGDEQGARLVEKAYHQGGFRAVNLAALHKLKEAAAKEYTSPLRMAEHAAGAGLYEESLRYLEQAFEQRAPFMIHLQHNLDLDPLHSDPRYWAIVKKMNMAPLQ